MEQNRPDYIAEVLAKVAQAKQELLSQTGDVEKARALVRLREAEHDLTVLKAADSRLEGDKKTAQAQVRLRREELRLAELESDEIKTAEAQERLRRAELWLAELEAGAHVRLSKEELGLAELEDNDKKKTAEAQVRLRREELRLAELESDDKKTAEAQVRLSKEELKLAMFEGEEELAHAERNLTEANLKLSVATASELLRNAREEDVPRLGRELEVARYALISHQGDGAGKFLSGEPLCWPGVQYLNCVWCSSV